MSLSYRNQSIDLQSKSVDWFLYDRDLRHERVKAKVFSRLICIKRELDVIVIFLQSNATVSLNGISLENSKRNQRIIRK